MRLQYQNASLSKYFLLVEEGFDANATTPGVQVVKQSSEGVIKEDIAQYEIDYVSLSNTKIITTVLCKQPVF